MAKITPLLCLAFMIFYFKALAAGNQNILKKNIGDDVLLTCELGLNPNRCDWFRDGSLIIPDQKRYTVTTNGNQRKCLLKIAGALEKDSGYYTCHSAQILDNNPEEHGTALVMQDPVTVVIAFFEGNSETNATFLPGSNVSMSCVSDGSVDTKYLWLKENATGIWFPFETLPNITIVASEGLYACAAKNNANDDYVASNTLRITISDVHVIENPQNATVKLGDNMTLICTFNGLVNFCNWNKDGIYFLPGNDGTVFIGDESIGDCTILIPNIQLQHDGIYFCEAHNVKSDEAKVLVLQAPKSPVIVFSGQEIPENGIIYLPNGIWPVSCKAEDGKPVAEIRWFEDVCVVQGREEMEISTVNPALTTIISTVNITLDENTPDVRKTCISEHPAYDAPGFKLTTVNFRSLGPVKFATATVVNHFSKSVKLSHHEKMELVCSASGSTIADYQWEIKREYEDDWTFLKSGPTIYTNAVAGVYRCKAQNRFNDGNAAISNEITISL